MPTMEANQYDCLFSMFKGEFGLRKSTQALTWPKPQYWVSTDQKMEVLNLPMKRWGINPKDIHYDDYSNWDKPRAKLEQFKVDCPFRTLVVDSITSFGDYINLQTMQVKTAEGKGKIVGNIRTNSVEDYNAEASAFRDLMATLKDIHKYHKVNIILIAHVVGQRAKDNEGNNLTHHSRVIITGGDKISGKIASVMSEVYHFNVETSINVDSSEGKYGLFTVHTGNDYARTGLPLERKITFNNDPLYDKWITPAIKKLKEEKPVITTIPEKKATSQSLLSIVPPPSPLPSPSPTEGNKP